MSVRVFADMLSQPARAVTIFCSAARIPHEVVRVRVGRGDTRTPEFVKINPRMRVPVIVDGDFILTESVAIMRYLAKEKEVEDHWYPRDSKAQARVDEYMEWQHLNIRCFMSSVLEEAYLLTFNRKEGSLFAVHKYLNPMITGKVDNMRVAVAEKALTSCLDDFERMWLRDGRSYMAGEEISVADILAVCELEQPSMAGFRVGEGRPAMAGYMERVRRDLNPHYDTHTELIYKLREQVMRGGVSPSLGQSPTFKNEFQNMP